jgi:hypothetical protein
MFNNIKTKILLKLLFLTYKNKKISHLIISKIESYNKDNNSWKASKLLIKQIHNNEWKPVFSSLDPYRCL